MENNNTVIAVGIGATEICFTDRHAYTVIKVVSDKKIVVQADNAKRTDSNGMSECQDYAYSANPNGTTHVVTLRKNGKWITEGESMKGGTRWAVGSRREYHDYSF